MKSKSFVVAFIFCVFMMGFISQANAQGPAWGRGPKPEKMIERLAKDLGLTEQQKQKYIEQAKKLDDERKIIDQKNKEIFGKIEEELMKDNPDKKAIYSHMQEISKNMNELQMKRMDQIIELRRELNPEQKAKLQEVLKKMKDHKRKSEK